MDKLIAMQVEAEVAALLAKLTSLKAHLTPGSAEEVYAHNLFKGVEAAYTKAQNAKELGE